MSAPVYKRFLTNVKCYRTVWNLPGTFGELNTQKRQFLRPLDSFVPTDSQCINNRRLFNATSLRLLNVVNGRPTFDLTVNPTFIFQSRNFSSTSTNIRQCWHCGRENDIETETFVCKCGVVQDVQGLTFFQVLGVTPSFDVDVTDLAMRYKNLQKILHPDKYSQKSQKEQELSEAQSSYVNKAYFTLLKPLPRALYMLELHGQPLEEDNSDVDQSFLMKIMEINEDIMDADTSESLKPIEEENIKEMAECIKDISNAFKCGDISLAKAMTVKLRYYTNIDGKIKEFYQRQFQ